MKCIQEQKNETFSDFPPKQRINLNSKPNSNSENFSRAKSTIWFVTRIVAHLGRNPRKPL